MLGTYAFDAFGLRTGTDSTTDPYAGFEGGWGYYADAETGLSLLGHRYYDTGTGRFINRDPIGYAGGSNLYAYTTNNPINAIDPDGTSQDPGGGSGTIRLSWAGFIPPATVPGFLGDHRGFCSNTPAYRIQQNIIINLRTHQVHVLTPQVGETHYSNGSPAGWASPDGMSGSGVYSRGGYDISITGSEGNPALYGFAPPIAYHVFIHVDPTGSTITTAGYHTNYPAFELWSYGVHGTHQEFGYNPVPSGYNPLTGLTTTSTFRVRPQPL